MLQQLLDSNTIRGQVVRLTQPAGPGTVILDLLLQQSNRLDVPPTYCRISAHQAREFTISEHEFDSIRQVDRHPLLWTHYQDELELFVQQPATEPDRLLGQLAARHLALTHGWLPFGACFNAAVPLAKLLSPSLVMFAEGPKPLITAYQEILEAAGARCSVISHGSMISADAPEGPQLLLLGRSFVIAESFEAEPISPPHE